MLEELHVRDIALIEEATMCFSQGLTVLTGETGAGKTALLSALRLICGQRADSAVVRDGSDEAVAEARFVETDAEHIVRRRLTAAGRSRCTLDGDMATVSELASAAGSVHVHSQHEQVQLLQPATQLAYLDAWAPGSAALLEAYATARDAYRACAEAFEALDRADADAARQLEFMRFTEAQIAQVNPVEGEYEQLEADLPRMQHAEQLANGVHEGLAALADDGGASECLADAVGALQRLAGIDPALDGIAERLAGLQYELDDAARDLGSYAADVNCDPQELQHTLERLEALSGLERRFGPGMERVFEAWQQAKEAVAAVDDAPQRLEAARQEMLVAKKAYADAAEALAALRREQAPLFCERLAQAVHELAMEDASFEFSFTALDFEQWTASGSERVELLYRPAADASPRPLGRIASGGELSRILLSLECMASDDERSRTIVFDEVDQGIGGATGTAVARSIAALSERAQVIVVTHLPQVAARAACHYVVEKGRNADGSVSTALREVEGDERVAELARMLAGTVDETALDHARSLLADAQGAAR